MNPQRLCSSEGKMIAWTDGHDTIIKDASVLLDLQKHGITVSGIHSGSFEGRRVVMMTDEGFSKAFRQIYVPEKLSTCQWQDDDTPSSTAITEASSSSPSSSSADRTLVNSEGRKLFTFHADGSVDVHPAHLKRTYGRDGLRLSSEDSKKFGRRTVSMEDPDFAKALEETVLPKYGSNDGYHWE